MGCPLGGKQNLPKQTFGGPLCFMKATELVISLVTITEFYEGKPLQIGIVRSMRGVDLMPE